MKRLIVMGCVGVVGALCLAAVLRSGAKAAAPAVSAGPSVPIARPMGKLIVHEWGTFTGFAGSDGVHLPFNTVIGSDLPPFVMNRMKHATRLDPKLATQLLFLKGGGAAALQRMETPVIYFYADFPGEVDVRVDFPNGLLTEFYPPVRDMGPRYGAGFGEFAFADPSPVAADAPQTKPSSIEPGIGAFLDWGRVRIVPRPIGDEGKLIPAVANESHYQFARNTDSALVQFADAKGEKHEEEFLFYRGLGNFHLPVSLAANGNDRFELRNAGPSPLGWAFLIHVEAAGHQPPRFARFESLTGNQTLTLPPANPAQGDLTKSIERSLVASGLFEKEARAMVETWKSSWLDEPGTRVLYIVPRPVTDALLPLRVVPTPDQTVRVLVGRIDVLTPEQESHLRSMMLAADATTTLSEQDVRLLTGLDRFLTPALERTIKLSGDGARRQADYLRDALSRSRTSRN